ncbi:MAG: spermidine synthase [Nitrospinales bacterium]
MDQKKSAIRLLGYSFLILFFELAMIRFIPAHVQVVSYFLNLVLVAAVLGMGLGLLLQSRTKDITGFFLPLLLLLLFSCSYFANTVAQVSWSDSDEWLWNYVLEVSPTSKKWGMVTVVSIMFSITTFMFVPLGHAVGIEFNNFKPLTAYTLNIFGSLLGLEVFALMSWFSTPPFIWFIFGGLFFIVLSQRRRDFLISLVCFPAILLLSHSMQMEGKEIWSPYYKINYFTKPDIISLTVNGSFHQNILNLTEKKNQIDKNVDWLRENYLLPYKFVNKMDDVLILGAGTGNDVALALQKGARHIDAVEIDGQFLDLGRKLHFLKPYDDPRVTTYIDDARSFLKKSEKKYDLIILGTLDSQTLLSGMSSIRLDNYVYTLESFKSIKDHLKPDGILILYHSSSREYISHKIYLTLDQAFGKPPLLKYQPDHRLFNFTYVSKTDGEESHPEFNYAYSRLLDQPLVRKSMIPTDNWPYLYLSHPTIPGHYLKTGTFIIIFSLILIMLVLGKKNTRNPDGTMFFLGAGFLLLETKSVTEMSLLFGSTWLVNVLVFMSILFLVMMANLTIIKNSSIPTRPMFFVLLGLVLISYFLPIHQMLGWSLWGQWIVGGAIVALPLFFSGIIFSSIFKTRQYPAKSLGYNLLGAILGGMLEYSSMALGTKSLYMVALTMYLLAYLFYSRETVK